jgi:nucleoside-diphosphate-sugar epimerase
MNTTVLRLFFLLFIQMLYNEAVLGLEQTYQKQALVCGAGGFIGYHLVNRYKAEGYWVRGVDIKCPEFGETQADEFIIADLRYPQGVEVAFANMIRPFDEVCQLAANMGGMGFISSHDAEIMHDSALINLNVLEKCRISGVKKIFYSSSACIYPERNQLDPKNPKCSEGSAYPAAPDTEYGWEKLFSERLYQAYARDYGMDVRIARFHNVFGTQGTWKGGREKAPAAICRKLAEASQEGVVEIWGQGDQTRSFLYIEECIEGIWRILQKEKPVPILNLGSEEMISINDLVKLIAQISEKDIKIRNIPGPEGVRGRNSYNELIKQVLDWAPSKPLKDGLEQLYFWINQEIQNSCGGNN